jgi:hypothetical protein
MQELAITCVCCRQEFGGPGVRCPGCNAIARYSGMTDEQLKQLQADTRIGEVTRRQIASVMVARSGRRTRPELISD